MLEAKLAWALTDFAVKVSCPQKRADLRVSGLDESVTPMEVAEALAAVGGCRVSEVRTGAIPWLQPHVKWLWQGRLRVEWSDVRVVALPAGPQQCYRCLERGQVRQRCTADVDRGDHCYKCGAPATGRDNVRRLPPIALRTSTTPAVPTAWTAGLDLRLLNRGSASTCVRYQGVSAVDVSWASSGARSPSPPLTRPYPHQQRQQRRWAIKALDEDALMAAVLAVAWSEPSTGPVVDVEGGAEWFHEAMVAVCDTAMPRARPPPRRPVYWWSAAIAELRDNCAAARRQYARSRRRRHRDEARTALLYAEYRHLTVQLQQAIRRAKADAWDGLLRSLDRDPWGRQYKFAVGKLRSWAPPITETLDPQLLGRVVGTLFPFGDELATFPRQVDQCDWSTELEVSEEELAGAVQCLRDRNTAPGPDGTFPPRWRFGRLVLLKKEGRDAESPSAYRPIVLLDEVGKLYERIVVSRLSRHQSRDGPDLAECPVRL
ncbi:uncharacterized protein LOC143432407 [Xylocopa sonorina]|uniref:uncharacterized protein LOC143432407 n=1 Tax=Xylocopa sonorina TaxID=1818115 RepID=UPI00403A9C6B